MGFQVADLMIQNSILSDSFDILNAKVRCFSQQKKGERKYVCVYTVCVCVRKKRGEEREYSLFHFLLFFRKTKNCLGGKKRNTHKLAIFSRTVAL